MKIVCIGSFGAGNYGDEAILIAVLERILADISGVEPIVVTADKIVTESFLVDWFGDDILKKVRLIEPLPMGFRSIFNGRFLAKIKPYKEADVLLYCGGGLFTDEESRRSVPMWSVYGILMKRWGKKVYGFGLGVGSIKYRISRSLFVRLLKIFDWLGVRDSASLKVVQSFNHEALITGDTAFLLSRGEVQKDSNNPYLVFSLRSWEKPLPYKKIAHFLDNIIEKYGIAIQLVPFQKKGQDDSEVLNKIIEHAAYKEYIFYSEYRLSLRHICDLIGRSIGVLGMRFHASLLAIHMGVSFLMMTYASKGDAFVKEYADSSWAITEEDWDEPEILSQKVDKLLNSHDALSIRNNLEKKVNQNWKELAATIIRK